MTSFKETVKSPHIKIALVTGVSIIVMAYFSKRILPEPIGYLPLAIPPFIASIYEGFSSRYKGSKIFTTWYWIMAILIATAIVILSYMA